MEGLVLESLHTQCKIKKMWCFSYHNSRYRQHFSTHNVTVVCNIIMFIRDCNFCDIVFYTCCIFVMLVEFHNDGLYVRMF